MNEKLLHGFIIKNSTRVNEIDADIIKMAHKKSGAELIYINRPDDNKTFAIGFKTIPNDDTGVFHILEHTVLAGSENFPVKDPMTAMLSGSLYTYLHAFTYPDKTIYPVSSKNNKAFLDLVNVYMDAVLHPLVLKNKSIFMSEGHHYEYTDDGKLDIGGIVYNEMQGAYSSPDELIEHYLSKNLYTGGTYSYDSGGFPDAIPTLSYEDFLKAHVRFYHPENSVIILDGRVELDKTLALIDSYLCNYEKTGLVFDISMGKIDTAPKTEYYPISKDEQAKDKTRLAISYPAFKHCDYIQHIAMSAAIDAIADTNSSPFKSAILKSGLCENVYAYYNASIYESSLTFQFIGVKDGKEDELLALFDKTVAKIIHTGIDNDKLEGSLNLIEFKTRESDFGSFPRGMVYMLSAMEYALYGEDVANAFSYDILFTHLREKLNTSYFTEILSTVLKNERVTVILKPDAELSSRREKEHRARLEKTQKNMTGTEKAKLLGELEEYERWQNTPDSAEALASIPRLKVSDIGPAEPEAPTEVITLDEATVIAHDMESSGILYTDFCFDVSDADEDTMHAMRILCAILPELDTEYSTADKFRGKLKKTLGDLSVSLLPTKNRDKVSLYLTFKSSALVSSLDKMCKLLDEYIYHTVYTQEEKIKQKLSQLYTSSREGITEDGLSLALMRSSASLDDLNYLNDLIFGYGYHKYLKSAIVDIDNTAKALLDKFVKIREKYLRRERLTLAVTAREAKNIAKKLVEVIKAGGTKAENAKLNRHYKQNEGIVIESTVGYSAASASFKSSGAEEYRGSLSVLCAIISYELLWNKIRIKGGAYDTGLQVKSNSGVITAYSYRDPSPVKSAEYFKSLVSDARKAVMNLDISKYIISTVGAADTVSTPRSSSFAATLLYLSGRDEKYKLKVREEILGTTKDELLSLLDLIEKAFNNLSVCIAAPKNLLDGYENYTVLEI